jgi:hypothetical protein
LRIASRKPQAASRKPQAASRKPQAAFNVQCGFNARYLFFVFCFVFSRQANAAARTFGVSDPG